jgi:hypothetical protein
MIRRRIPPADFFVGANGLQIQALADRSLKFYGSRQAAIDHAS